MSYLTTKSTIYWELRNNIERLTEYPNKADDLVAEIAEGFVPVYNSDIIKEWTELEADYSDRWKEYGYDANRNEGGIIQLMSIDLIFFYLEVGAEAWAELKVELGQVIECPNHAGNFDCNPFCELCEGEQEYNPNAEIKTESE
jgi:hypothetical protein